MSKEEWNSETINSVNWKKIFIDKNLVKTKKEMKQI